MGKKPLIAMMSPTLKNSLILVICLFYNSFCHGQYKIVNESSKLKDSSILFAFFKNKMFIAQAIKGTFSLKAKSSTIEPTSNPYKFLMSCERPGRDTLSIIQAGKVIFKQPFLIVDTLQLKARWGAISDLVAGPMEIILNRKMVVAIDGCNCDRIGNITNFRIDIVTKSTSVSDYEKSVDVNGGEPSAAFFDTVRKLVKGDKIRFSNIRAVGTFCPRILDSFILTIK